MKLITPTPAAIDMAGGTRQAVSKMALEDNGKRH